MTTMKRCASLLVLMSLAAVPGVAAANGDFAGEWKLDPEKSKLFNESAPTDISMTLALDGENLVIERTTVRKEGPDTANLTYVTNGEPHPIVGRTQTYVTTSKWKGKKLEVSYQLDIDGMDIKVAETWKLRKGGLEIKYVSKAPDMGIGNQTTFITKHFFVRQ